MKDILLSSETNLFLIADGRIGKGTSLVSVCRSNPVALVFQQMDPLCCTVH
jgi:hypothetical protein